jgi:hypothetical protein
MPEFHYAPENAAGRADDALVPGMVVASAGDTGDWSDDIQYAL